MKWSDKLAAFSRGEPLTYPKRISRSFFWETTAIDREMTANFKQIFIEHPALDKLQEDWSTYQPYIDKSKNRYVTSFYNLSGDVFLVIPMPFPHKSFTTIKDFIDNASAIQQKMFWKKAATEIRRQAKKHGKVYVSTHGFGVPYFHLRIEAVPIHYNSDLASE